MKTMIWIIALVSATSGANANDVGARVAKCKSGTTDFSVFVEMGKALVHGVHAKIVSSKLSRWGFNEMVFGTLDLQKKSIELPDFWDPKIINLDDCVFNQPFKEGPLIAYPVKLQQYFLFFEPGPGESLEELINRGDAKPVVVNATCRTSEMSSDPDVLKCEALEFPLGQIPICETPTGECFE